MRHRQQRQREHRERLGGDAARQRQRRRVAAAALGEQHRRQQESERDRVELPVGGSDQHARRVNGIEPRRERRAEPNDRRLHQQRHDREVCRDHRQLDEQREGAEPAARHPCRSGLDHRPGRRVRVEPLRRVGIPGDVDAGAGRRVRSARRRPRRGRSSRRRRGAARARPAPGRARARFTAAAPVGRVRRPPAPPSRAAPPRARAGARCAPRGRRRRVVEPPASSAYSSRANSVAAESSTGYWFATTAGTPAATSAGAVPRFQSTRPPRPVSHAFRNTRRSPRRQTICRERLGAERARPAALVLEHEKPSRSLASKWPWPTKCSTSTPPRASRCWSARASAVSAPRSRQALRDERREGLREVARLGAVVERRLAARPRDDDQHAQPPATPRRASAGTAV